MKRRLLLIGFLGLVAGGALAQAHAASPPSVTLTAPADGQAIHGVFTVTWSYTGIKPTSLVNVEAAPDGVTFSTIATVPIDDRSATWNTASGPDAATYVLRVAQVKGKASDSANVVVDNTAPLITFVARTAPNATGWNNADVTAEWGCADALSGAVAPVVSQTLSAEGADQSLTGTCQDVAGNTASDTQGGINIDKTAPSITGSRSPAPNAAGWNNTDVEVSFSCTDALSGVASCSGDTVLSGEGAGQSATGVAEDLAGNTAETTVGGINIDKTGPATTIDAPLLPVLVNPVNGSLTGGVVDNLSGASLTTLTFIDQDGNETTVQATYTSGYGTTSTLWRASTEGLAPGLYLVTASSDDAAGNGGPPSNPLTLLLV